MGSFSVWHSMIWVFLAIIYLIPAARILRKAGFSGWLCLLLLVPLLNLIMYWIFAFVRWPVERAVTPTDSR